MKVFNAFAYLFSILSFLTLGSLLVIVSLHILSVEDAVLKVQEIYTNPWRSIQVGMVGLAFITIGLAFTKMMLKKGRDSEALIFQSEIGPIVVSVTAIEDVIKKILKRFHLVKDWKIKIQIQGRDVSIKLRLILWSGGRVPELLSEVQQEIRARVRKLLGSENRLEIACDVQKIEDHEADIHDLESDQAVSL